MTSPDFSTLKKDFPILQTERHGKPLTFLDSAASSQRPTQVIDAMDYTYTHAYANVHRGVYGLAEAATNAYETARLKVARFIGAPDSSEIIFTKNATEALNLVAFSWGKANLGPNDAIVLTTMEHHANIVPWQMLQAEKGFEIRWIPLGADGKLDLSDLDALLDGAKLLSVASMSNVLGTINPLGQLIAAARKAGATVCIDACQSVPHMPTNVAELGADFLAFSGHKMLGPSGIGVLWGRMELLDGMPPFLGGGGMISNVTTEGFMPDAVPSKFEAGTPPIVEAIGLGAAIDYLDAVGMNNIRQHEIELTAYAMRTLTERLGDVLTIHGPSEPSERGGVLSLELEGVHAHDVSQVLDSHGVAVRPGHHCAKPLMKELGVNATARASFYLYNDTSDVDTLADALREAHSFFAI